MQDIGTSCYFSSILKYFAIFHHPMNYLFFYQSSVTLNYKKVEEWWNCIERWYSSEISHHCYIIFVLNFVLPKVYCIVFQNGIKEVWGSHRYVIFVFIFFFLSPNIVVNWELFLFSPFWQRKENLTMENKIFHNY